MSQNAFSINGRYFNVKIPQGGIKRNFSVADSDKAGRALSGTMKRDIIGTFYNYTIDINVESLSKQEYDELYDIISAPVDSHMITVPYGQSSLTFEAYVTSGSDTLEKITTLGNEWQGLSINFIAMSPQKRGV